MPLSPEPERVVVIGAGPAGYTAAIYSARAMLKPLLLAGFEPGGQLMITTDVENYPGFADPIQGPWLMEEMRKQAEHVGARHENEHVVSLDLRERPFRIVCDSGRIVFAQSLILATGAKAKWLGLKSEEELRGAGVSACATCDGFFFKAKDVVVVGGGNLSPAGTSLYVRTANDNNVVEFGYIRNLYTNRCWSRKLAIPAAASACSPSGIVAYAA